MKVFQYIFLSICAMAEAALLIFGILSLVIFILDPDPDVPIAMVAAVTACAMVLLGITVSSFIKAAKDREHPILYGFLFKGPVLIFTLGIIWFALGIPEAGWIAVIPSVLLGALILCIPKLKENDKKLQAAQNVRSMTQFTGEKAEWAWEDAAAEYRRIYKRSLDNRIDNQELHDQLLKAKEAGKEFSDKENEKIYAYAGKPTAYFLGWLIRNDLVSDSFREAFGPESIQSVRDKNLTPVEFYAGFMDYVLSRDDIAPEILPFVDLYYRDGSKEMAFSHRMPRYFFDYYKAVCSSFDVPRYYCVDFTWESFERLSRILDKQLYEFRRSGFDEDTLEDLGERLGARYFDTTAELYMEPGTPYAYIKKCSASFTDMSEGLRHEIAEFLIEYCDEELPEEPTAEWVLRHLAPCKVVVFRPEAQMPVDEVPVDAVPADAVPAYVVLSESDWDPEHGISFTVIGDHVVAFGGYGDAEPPYKEELQWRFRILEDAAQGNVCAAEVIPARFGGKRDSADNQVTIPKAAAERKQQYEDLIEALYVLNLAEHYDCKITYHEGRPNYLFLEATSGDRRTFADSIALG